jgi:hypothetical protein
MNLNPNLYVILGPRSSGKTTLVQHWLHGHAGEYDKLYYALPAVQDEHYSCCRDSERLTHEQMYNMIASISQLGADNSDSKSQRKSDDKTKTEWKSKPVVFVIEHNESFNLAVPRNYAMNARHHKNIVVFYIAQSIHNIPAGLSFPMILMSSQNGALHQTQTIRRIEQRVLYHYGKLRKDFFDDVQKTASCAPVLITEDGCSQPFKLTVRYDTAEETASLLHQLTMFPPCLSNVIVSYTKPSCCSIYFWQISKNQ